MDSDSPNRIQITVGESGSGLRLDVFIAGAVEDLSRSRAKALILSGMVSVDTAVAQEPRRPVRTGERVSITLPPPSPAVPAGEPLPLDIVYEDDDLIVINKPPGMVVHPAPGHSSGTLVNALIYHCRASLSGIGGIARPGIVHRLDRDTSGLLVAAKTDRAHIDLSRQFADHGRTGPLERMYVALCWGVPARPSGTITARLGRAANNREKIEVKRHGGREAITHYTVTDRFGPAKETTLASLLTCRLETGRTHQIRVHLATIGHPVIGDPVYGAGFATKALLLPEPIRTQVAGFPRQALHAGLLGFEHPVTRQALRFERPPPDDMLALIAALKSL